MNGSDQNRQHVARGLANAALHLAARGNASAIELVREGVRLDPVPETLAARCRVARNLFDTDSLEDAVAEAEASNWVNADLQSLVGEMKAGPLAAIRLSRQLAQRRSLEFEPVAGRMLYVLHKSLPHASDGYAMRSHGIARGLLARGADLVCVTRPGFPVDLSPGSLPTRQENDVETVDGVHYHRLLYPRRSDLPPVRSECMMHASFAYLEQASTCMREVIRQYRPASVLAASNLATALPACLAARSLGLPFVYEVRGFWEITRASHDPAYLLGAMGRQERFLESALARAADRVVTLTGPMRKELVARGVDPERITLAPNACDPDAFLPVARNDSLTKQQGLDPDTPVIGYIGSFNHYEGLEDLVRACCRLRQEGLVFRVLLAGSEPADAHGQFPVTRRIANIAALEGLHDWLIMPGRVPHSEVSDWYSLIDIAPFPRKSLRVTELVSPLKPLEALAMEKAVIASDVGGMGEIVENGQTGLVVPSDNVGALAEALRRLLQNSELRRRLGAAGRKWIRDQRSWQHSADHILRSVRSSSKA